MVCVDGVVSIDAVLSFQLDSGLGAYPKQHHKVWTRLTKYISASVLQVRHALASARHTPAHVL